MNLSTKCSETSGFLFKHKCENPGVHNCFKCGKTICHKHSHQSNRQNLLCTTCIKKDADDYHHYRDDPYFYGDHHYAGWGTYHGSRWRDDQDHDHDDFTEADGAATDIAKDEGFETEMEGS